jgi:hypothetical protein
MKPGDLVQHAQGDVYPELGVGLIIEKQGIWLTVLWSNGAAYNHISENLRVVLR